MKENNSPAKSWNGFNQEDDGNSFYRTKKVAKKSDEMSTQIKLRETNL